MSESRRNSSPDNVKAMYDALRRIEELTGRANTDPPSIHECYRLLGSINAIAQLGVVQFERLTEEVKHGTRD